MVVTEIDLRWRFLHGGVQGFRVPLWDTCHPHRCTWHSPSSLLTGIGPGFSNCRSSGGDNSQQFYPYSFCIQYASSAKGGPSSPKIRM